MYYGLVSLQYNSRIHTYYAYIYMNAAKRLALSGHEKAKAANASNPSPYGPDAEEFSYRDWYYKSQASRFLYYTYLYPRSSFTARAISNGYWLS